MPDALRFWTDNKQVTPNRPMKRTLDPELRSLPLKSLGV